MIKMHKTMHKKGNNDKNAYDNSKKKKFKLII